jgi:hypothetical protein
MEEIEEPRINHQERGLSLFMRKAGRFFQERIFDVEKKKL